MEKYSFLDLAFQHSSEGIFTIGPDGLVKTINRAAMKMLAVKDPADFVGQSSHRLIYKNPDGSPRPDHECPVFQAFTHGKAGHLDSEIFFRLDGTHFEADCRADPIFDREKIVGAIVSFTDITERKRHALEIAKQSAWFKAMLSCLGDAVIATDATETRLITFMNQAAAALTGWSVEESIGEPLEQILHTDIYIDSGPTDCHVDRVLIVSRQNEKFLVERKSSSILSLDNHLLGSVILLRDITSEEESRRRLQDNEFKLKMALESAQMGTWNLDLKTNRTTTSVATARILGLEKIDDIVFDLVSWFVHPDDRERISQARQIAIKNHSAYSQEFRIVRTDGTMRWVLTKGNVSLGIDGQVSHFSGIITDVTDKKEAEFAAQMAKAEAEAANDAKSTFLANMSHEIRTPLSAIIGFSNLLEDPQLSTAERDQFVKTIQRNGSALVHLIDDILDLAKVEAGKLEIQSTECSIANLISEVETLFVEKLKQKGLGLIVDFKNLSHDLVLTDNHRVRQVIVNLLSNAIKFTDKGIIEITLKTIETQSESFIHVDVKDSGVGLSDDQKARLFHPFSQADASVAKKYGGTGLGLALSKKIAKALGGDIWIDRSQPNVGTTFSFRFLAPHSSVRSIEPQSQEPMIEHEKSSSLLAGLRVLLAEDSKDNQVLIEKLLSRVGAQVLIANNGAEAIRICSKEKIDLVLMDIQMPIMDGYTATRELRKSGFKNQIVALTAHAMLEERRSTIEAGCDDHISKPISPREFAEIISRVLKKNNLGPKNHDPVISH